MSHFHSNGSFPALRFHSYFRFVFQKFSHWFPCFMLGCCRYQDFLNETPSDYHWTPLTLRLSFCSQFYTYQSWLWTLNAAWFASPLILSCIEPFPYVLLRVRLLPMPRRIVFRLQRRVYRRCILKWGFCWLGFCDSGIFFYWRRYFANIQLTNLAFFVALMGWFIRCRLGCRKCRGRRCWGIRAGLRCRWDRRRQFCFAWFGKWRGFWVWIGLWFFRSCCRSNWGWRDWLEFKVPRFPWLSFLVSTNTLRTKACKGFQLFWWHFLRDRQLLSLWSLLDYQFFRSPYSEDRGCHWGQGWSSTAWSRICIVFWGIIWRWLRCLRGWVWGALLFVR